MLDRQMGGVWELLLQSRLLDNLCRLVVAEGRRTKNLLELHDRAVRSKSGVDIVLDLARLILVDSEVIALGLDLVGLCNVRHAGPTDLEVAENDFEGSHSRI